MAVFERDLPGKGKFYAILGSLTEPRDFFASYGFIKSG